MYVYIYIYIYIYIHTHTNNVDIKKDLTPKDTRIVTIDAGVVKNYRDAIKISHLQTVEHLRLHQTVTYSG